MEHRGCHSRVLAKAPLIGSCWFLPSPVPNSLPLFPGFISNEIWSSAASCGSSSRGADAEPAGLLCATLECLLLQLLIHPGSPCCASWPSLMGWDFSYGILLVGVKGIQTAPLSQLTDPSQLGTIRMKASIDKCSFDKLFLT